MSRSAAVHHARDRARWRAAPAPAAARSRSSGPSRSSSSSQAVRKSLRIADNMIQSHSGRLANFGAGANASRAPVGGRRRPPRTKEPSVAVNEEPRTAGSDPDHRRHRLSRRRQDVAGQPARRRRAPAAERIGVVVNEAGEVGLDGQLLGDVGRRRRRDRRRLRLLHEPGRAAGRDHAPAPRCRAAWTGSSSRRAGWQTRARCSTRWRASRTCCAWTRWSPSSTPLHMIDQLDRDREPRGAASRCSSRRTSS